MISKEAQQLFTMCSIVIYSISSNFFFIPQKDLFCWQWYWNFFFFFCSNKIFISFSGLFRSFCIFHLQKDFNIFRMLLFGVFLCSEGSNHIDNSVCDKSMKLSELHYNVTRNSFLNRDTFGCKMFSLKACQPMSSIYSWVDWAKNLKINKPIFLIY